MLRGILTALVATVTIFFLVYFLLREGRRWVETGVDLLPPAARPRWERVLAGITRTIRGYVTGNLLISLIAGVVAYVTLIAVGVPYALPLAVLVAVLDLIPLVGATLATVLAAAVALGEGVWPCLVVRGGVHRLPAAREPPAAAPDLRPHGAAVAAGGADLDPHRRRASRGSSAR